MTYKRRRKFSILRFLLFVAMQVGTLLLGWWYFFPEHFQTQWNHGFLETCLTFHGFVVFNAFVEFGFHRWWLHAAPYKFMEYWTVGHRHHHHLTDIKLLRTVAQNSERRILNEYPITKPEQYEDSAFPPYAIVFGLAIYIGPLWLLQQLLPGLPILLAGSASLVFGLTMYEVIHAIEHFPYEWWERMTNHPRQGWFWKRVYGFHHMHHANIKCNEAISGFYGVPVWDLVFRTYHQPKDLLLHNRVATAKDFTIPQPWPFIRSIDRWATRRESQRRHKERNAA